MKKILSYVLIIAGILVILYPFGSKLYYDYWNQKLLDEYEALYALEDEAAVETEDEYAALDDVFVEGAVSETLGDDLIDISDYEVDTGALEPRPSTEGEDEATPEPPKEKPKPQPALPIIGQIKIPKINVKMAILEDATERHLNRGAAHINGTSYFGEVGNIGIAGHRGRSYGLMFNRLDELGEGDTIEVSSGGIKYVYTVYKTHIVEPTDVSVLYRSKEHEVLTLVTCDPVVNPTHRLIVHAVREP